MLRKTLTILSLIGLLLSVGAWGVSYFHVNYYSQSYDFMVSLSPGFLRLIDVEKMRNISGIIREPEPGLIIHGWQGRFNTYWGLPRIRINNRVTSVALPFWIPILVFGPSLAFLYLPVHRRRKRRRKRKKFGLCLECGYDLRGSKARCPECGAGFSS